MRKSVAAIGLSLFLLAVPAAQGATENYLDRDAGVRFLVHGLVLTVRLEPQVGKSPPDIRKDLWGKQVRVACSASFTARERTPRRAVVIAEQLWPEGQLKISYTLDRDISDRLKWCLLEGSDGEDAAAAMFEPFIRLFANDAPGRRIGRVLRRHFRADEKAEVWLPQAFAIVVDDRRTAIATTLRRNARGRTIARRLCRLATGAGVDTGKTAVYGRNDVKLRSC